MTLEDYEKTKDIVFNYDWDIHKNFNDNELANIFILTRDYEDALIADMEIFEKLSEYINKKLFEYEKTGDDKFCQDIVKIMTKGSDCSLRFLLCNDMEVLNIVPAYDLLSKHNVSKVLEDTLLQILKEKSETDLYDLSTVVNVLNHYTELPFLRNFPIRERIVAALSFYTETGKNYSDGYNYDLNKDIFEDICKNCNQIMPLSFIAKQYNEVLFSTSNIMVDLNNDNYTENFLNNMQEIYSSVFSDDQSNEDEQRFKL